MIRASKTGSIIDPNQVRNEGYEMAAVRVAKELHRGSGHSTFINEHLAKMIGQPTTKVNGLYGDVLDTRAVALPRSKRKLNSLDSRVIDSLQQKEVQMQEDQQLAQAIHMSLNQEASSSSSSHNCSNSNHAQHPQARPTQQLGAYPYGKKAPAVSENYSGSRHQVPASVGGGSRHCVPAAVGGVTRPTSLTPPVPQVLTTTGSSVFMPFHSGPTGADLENPILLFDSSPESSITNPNVPPMMDDREFFHQVRQKALTGSRASPILIDGATASADEKENQRVNSTAYLHLTGVSVKGLPKVDESDFIRLISNFHSQNRTLTPLQGLEAMKTLFDYNSL